MKPALVLGAAAALLAGCGGAPGDAVADRLSGLLSARLGRHVEPHMIVSEPDGVHATCGYAGDPPRRRARRPAPGDVAFVWAAGVLATSSDGRPDFAEVLARTCPSLPRAVH